MAFEFLLAFGYALLFIYVILKARFFKVEGIAKSWIVFAFTAKIVAGLVLSMIYIKYYTDRSTADVFKFFDDSKILFGVLKTHPSDFLKIVFHIDAAPPEMKFWQNQDVLFNDNQTMIVLNTLFRCFSIGSYAVHVVFINFLSFTGLIALYRLFQSHLKSRAKELFVLLMFLPSVLLWGSGLLKDSLLLFALGWLLYFFHKLVHERISAKSVIGFAGAAVLLVFTKVYILLLILPALVAWIWTEKKQGRGVVIKFVVCYAAYFLIVFNIGSISDKYDVADILYYKQQSFYAVADSTKAGSVIKIPKFNATAGSVLFHSPDAVARVFGRPTIFDSRSPLILMAAIENLFILILIAMSAIRFKRNNFSNTSVFWLSVFFVLCLFALTGLITPVLGAMVRYKVPALPFLMFIVVALYDKTRAKE